MPQQYDLQELTADFVHEQWSNWMRYLFSKGTFNDDDGTWTMPAWAVERWQRQLNTPYEALPDNEKETDLAEANKFLSLLKSILLEGQDEDRIKIKTIDLKQEDLEGAAIGQFILEILFPG